MCDRIVEEKKEISEIKKNEETRKKKIQKKRPKRGGDFFCDFLRSRHSKRKYNKNRNMSGTY